jgi:hypothetical protein
VLLDSLAALAHRWDRTGCGPVTHDVTCEAEPVGRRRTLLLAVALVDVVALVAVAVWWFVLRDDGKTVPAAEAAAALDRIVEAAPSDENSDLDVCPLGEVEDAISALGLDGDALARRSQQVRVGEESYAVQPGVACYAEDEPEDPDDELGVGLQAARAPVGGREESLERGLPGGDLTIEGEPERHHDGTVLRFCWQVPEERRLCAAEWVHDQADLAISLYTSADRTSDEVSEALNDLLPEIIGSLAER